MYRALVTRRKIKLENFSSNLSNLDNNCGDPVMASEAQEQEVRTGVGGASSPLGPDSTSLESDLHGSKMEARMLALEAKLIKDNEERFSRMEASMASLFESLNDNIKISKTPTVIPDGDPNTQIQQCLEKYVPMLEQSLHLNKAIDEMKEKLDMLLGGENEANKLIDNIVPNLDKVKESIKKVEKDCYKCYDEAKKIREDQKEDRKKMAMIEDILHNSVRLREDQDKFNKKFDARLSDLTKLASVKRERSRSESGERKRHHSSRSRSRSRKRGRGNSRETSISSVNRSKTEAEIERKITKVEESVGTIMGSVDGLRKDLGDRKVFEDQMLTTIVKVATLLQTQDSAPSMKIPPIPARWEDDDRSPSPPSRMSRSPLKQQSKDKVAKKKKKARSPSSSNDSSDDEREQVKDKKKRGGDFGIDMKAMEIIVTKVSSIEEKFQKGIKKLKESNATLETNSQCALERVSEMTAGVQVIAENLDNINDIARKVESIEVFRSKLDKLDMIDRVWEELSSVKSLVRSSGAGMMPPPLSLPGDDGGWETEPSLGHGRGRPHSGQHQTNAAEVADIVRESIEARFCEVTGFIEDVYDKLSKKIDTNRGGEDDAVPDLRRRVRRLEDSSSSGLRHQDGPMSPSFGGGLTPPPPIISSPLSDLRATQLERKINEISPKLDDLYIKVLPCLTDIRNQQRKEDSMEANINREIQGCYSLMEKLLESFEDFNQAHGNDRGPGSLDRRINSAIEFEGVSATLGNIESGVTRNQASINDCLSALVEMRTYNAKQSSLDKLERMVSHISKEDLPFSGDGDRSHGPGIDRLERRLNTVLEFLKKEEKTLAQMMKNSDSDAKSLSQCNTALQGMKTSVSANGRDLLQAISKLEDHLVKVADNVNDSVGGVKNDLSSIDGTLGEVVNLVRNVSGDEEALDKMRNSLDKLSSSVRSLEKSGRHSSGSSRKSIEKESSPVAGDLIMSGDIKQVLEDITSNTNKFQDEFRSSVNGLKADVKKTDTNVAKAIQNVVMLLKSSVEIQKQTKPLLTETEKKLITSIKEMKENSNDSARPIVSSPEPSAKLESIDRKLDKISRNVGRCKMLLEDDSEDEDDKSAKMRKHKRVVSEAAGGVTNTSSVDLGEVERLLADVSSKLEGSVLLTRLECLDDKLDKIHRGSSDKKIDDIAFKLSEMEESISRRIEDDLSANVDKVDKMSEVVQEVKNIVTEVGDRMITSKNFTNSQAELRKLMSNLNSSITIIPDEFSSQATAMEENLCFNMESKIREVFKQHWDDLMNEIDQILSKLTTIKRYVKFSSREGSLEDGESEQPTLETVVSKVNDVAEKLAVVHTALESGILGADNHHAEAGQVNGVASALLLEEIRKRADMASVNGLKKDMFTAVHNVQNRMLEEQAKLLNSLTNSRNDNSSSPSLMTLVECLNKVRESQNLIVSTQNTSFKSQTSTNRILADVVNNLELTQNLVERFRDSRDSSIVAQVGTVCEDLGSAVTGLMSAQEGLANCSTNSMTQLETLIKSAGHLLREDSWHSKKRLSAGGGDLGPTAKRRVKGGVRMLVRTETEESGSGAASPASEPGHEADTWHDTEIKQCGVKLHQAILSPRQKAGLRKSVETPDTIEEDDTEIKDEFASPEKS